MQRVIGYTLCLLAVVMIAVGALWLWQSVPETRVAPEAVVQRAREVRTVPVEAEVPWLRDISEPRPVRAPLASSAWSGRRPAPASLSGDIPQATCPWVRDITQNVGRISVPVAIVPWRQP